MDCVVLEPIKIDRIYQPGEIVKIPPAEIRNLKGLVKPKIRHPYRKRQLGKNQSLFRISSLREYSKDLLQYMLISQSEIPGRDVRAMTKKQVIAAIKELRGF